MSRAHRFWRQIPIVAVIVVAPWMIGRTISPAEDVGQVDQVTTVAGSTVERFAFPGTSAIRSAGSQTPATFMAAPPSPLDEGSPGTTSVPAYESIGSAALARIPYAWQDRLPAWSVTFHRSNGALRGVTDGDTFAIDIYVHSTDAFAVARIVAHELGHAFDLTMNDTASRRGWKAARGIGELQAWWPAVGTADFDTGAGDFAECFSSWILGTGSQSDFGTCSAEDFALLASMLNS